MTRLHHRTAGWLALLMSAWLAVAAVASFGLGRGGAQSVDLRPVAALVMAGSGAGAAGLGSASLDAAEEEARSVACHAAARPYAGMAYRGEAPPARISPATASRHQLERLYYRHCSLLR